MRPGHAGNTPGFLTRECSFGNSLGWDTKDALFLCCHFSVRLCGAAAPAPLPTVGKIGWCPYGQKGRSYRWKSLRNSSARVQDLSTRRGERLSSEQPKESCGGKRGNLTWSLLKHDLGQYNKNKYDPDGSGIQAHSSTEWETRTFGVRSLKTIQLPSHSGHSQWVRERSFSWPSTSQLYIASRKENKFLNLQDRTRALNWLQKRKAGRTNVRLELKAELSQKVLAALEPWCQVLRGGFCSHPAPLPRPPPLWPNCFSCARLPPRTTPPITSLVSRGDFRKPRAWEGGGRSGQLLAAETFFSQFAAVLTSSSSHKLI